MKEISLDKIKDWVWVGTKIVAIAYGSFQIGMYFNNLKRESDMDRKFKIEAAQRDSVILAKQKEMQFTLEGLNLQNEIFVQGLIDMGEGHEKILKLQAKIIRESVKEPPNIALIEQCELNISEIIEDKFPQYKIGVKPVN
jgi:hypothetical protein